MELTLSKAILKEKARGWRAFFICSVELSEEGAI